MDTLYRNGTVITMERPLRAEAVLVRDGRIAAVGAAAELRAQAQGPLRSADLKGCTLLPAFVDAHSHFAAAASRFSIFSQGVSRSLREMTAKSWVSGAPSTAAPPQAAVMPGTTSMSMGGYSWATS